MMELQRNPLRTKAITSAFIYFSSDLLAQIIVILKTKFLQYLSDRRDKKHELGTGSLRLTLDFFRTLKFTTFGLLVAGPFFHYWNKAIGQYMKNRSIFLQIAADRLFAEPTLICLYYIWDIISSYEVKNWVLALKTAVDKKLAPIITASLLLWVPAQYFNLKYVPMLFRIFGTNFIAFFWLIYFSYANHR